MTLDVTDLLLKGDHPVLRLGAYREVWAPYFLHSSMETHPNGIPLHQTVDIDHVRYTIGLDDMGKLAYWTLKKSQQDRPFILMSATGEVDLWDTDAFRFLAVLEDLNVGYSREIWANAVCVVTILRSGVSLSFDLDPSIAKGPAAIQHSAEPLYLGGDVFRRPEAH